MTIVALTVRNRILVHLARFSSHQQDHHVPVEVTQQGIAQAVGIWQRHVPQYIRPMIVEGLVSERSSYVKGGRQHRKVYFLTPQGDAAAAWLESDVPSAARPTRRKPRTTGRILRYA